MEAILMKNGVRIGTVKSISINGRACNAENLMICGIKKQRLPRKLKKHLKKCTNFLFGKTKPIQVKFKREFLQDPFFDEMSEEPITELNSTFIYNNPVIE